VSQARSARRHEIAVTAAGQHNGCLVRIDLYEYLGVGTDTAMLKIESEREDDGRWIAEVASIPGVLTYGASEAEARAKAQALALRAIADRLENGEPLPKEIADVFAAA
jgi:predicted RNase H-like HicB family nuclease